uniref:Uncharacterized protein n=1 Tax=Amphimedon queenslandica TaxID=400682 RepID=A0A1X7SZV5_AMPQE
VSSLNIRIDGDNGIDSIECLTEQPQSSCQSLKYVADTINNTGNLTIEIISPTLSLQGSVIFTDINGLTINGQGASISCRNGSIPYGNSGIVFDTCSNVKLNSFTIEHCGVIGIDANQFINNSATTIGGALYMDLSSCVNLYLFITASNFNGNRAGTAGGAIGFIVHEYHCHYIGTIPFGFSISLFNCHIINNKAKFGGGVAIQIVHYEYYYDIRKVKKFFFHFCHFTGNKAMASSAVDINSRSQNVYQYVRTVMSFENCCFNENMAEADNNQQGLRGKLFKATLYATDTYVYFVAKISFVNNTGTALYAVNSCVRMSHGAQIRFFNNTGDQGGAIFLAEDSIMTFTKRNSSLINISNNKAHIGGAIYIQSLIKLHEGPCFLFQTLNITFHFSNNIATSGFGHDIFASTLQNCVTFYGGNATTLFKAGKMGKFEFSSWTSPPVATAPVELSINEKELVPYPGIPYNMTITQMDEFDNNVTSLQLFPLSATLIQNVHNNSSLKIDITYSIADNYIIVFKGTVGDTATLLLQTTEYSARKLINITLYHCPPGYTFQINTCHCNSNHYYGISGRLEDNAAIIDGGLWAGYIGEKFATADCVTSLCDYHNSKGMVYCVVVVSLTIPLTFTLLAFIV